MEVLTMLKFWKSNSNTSKLAAATTTTDFSLTVNPSTVSGHLTDDSDDDDDDSFFELELTSPSQHSEKQSYHHDNINDDEIKVFKKPKSPISIIPSRKLFNNVITMMMKRKNNRVEDFSDIDSVSSSFYSPKRISNDSTKSDTDTDTDADTYSSFTVKFKIEDGSIVPKLTRTQSSNGSRSTSTSPKLESRNADVLTSKRFSKDSVQKYVNNLIKPKSSSKKCCNNGGNSSPLMKEKEQKQSSRFKVKCKELGKRKSASAVIGFSSPVSFPVRNDFPADGIEGAILHCKRSLTSSTKCYSALSRCSSDPSH